MLVPTDSFAPHHEGLASALAQARLNDGESLLEASERAPVLVVFLRHTGCPFCVEALRDIARQRATIEGTGVRIVLVHMGKDSEVAFFFDSFGVGDLARLSDPGQTLYRSFDLRRGGIAELMGLKVWARLWPAWRAGKRAAHAAGDPRQMPGTFLIHRGQVMAAYRHKRQSDRPNYCAIARSG